jgi:hypothetical protein
MRLCVAAVLVVASCGGKAIENGEAGIVGDADGSSFSESGVSSDSATAGMMGQPCFADGTCDQGLTCETDTATTTPTMPAHYASVCVSN